MTSDSRFSFDNLFTFDRVFHASKILLHIVILATILPVLFYAISMSFQPSTDWYGLNILPSEIVTRWYAESFSSMAPALMNSYLRALGAAILSLIICVPSAYAFSREDFVGDDGFFFSIVGVQLFPPIIVIVPLLVTYLSLNLTDTIVGLWIVDMIFAVPLGVWVLQDFFNNLPVSLEDAARVYGCSKFSAFVRVVLPLAMPAMLAVGFLVFIRSWNEYLFAQLLTSNDAQVATILLVQATGDNAIKNWGIIMSETMIISIIPVSMYFVARRSITSAFSA